MTLTLTPIGKTFVAAASGIDLRGPITQADVEDIENALAQWGVLAFRRMPLNDDQQQAFIERFGPPSLVQLAELKSAKSAHPHFFDVSTVEDDGSKIDPNSPRGMYLRANQIWHTDGSQAQPPIRLTVLSARTLPPAPPATEYADMRAAYDDLDEDMKRRIDGMQVEHSIFYSRAKMGMKLSDFTADAMKTRPPVIHPLVRTNPRTGRKSLYLASHAARIVGLPDAEGEALIALLTEHATQDKYCYAHDWQPDDVVMWDDSWTMHRATPYDGPHPRVLRWSGVREVAAV